jgi:hypothetical protein
MGLEYDRVSYTFSQEEMDAIRQAMESIREKINPALVRLSPQLRRRLLPIGDKTHPFVEQCLDYSKKFPHLVSPHLDVAEFQNDWDLTIQAKVLLRELETIKTNVTDIFLGAGADAYAHARNFYGGTKNAANHNVKDAPTIYADLKQKFRKTNVQPEEEAAIDEVTKVKKIEKRPEIG